MCVCVGLCGIWNKKGTFKFKSRTLQQCTDACVCVCLCVGECVCRYMRLLMYEKFFKENGYTLFELFLKVQNARAKFPLFFHSYCLIVILFLFCYRSSGRVSHVTNCKWSPGATAKRTKKKNDTIVHAHAHMEDCRHYKQYGYNMPLECISFSVTFLLILLQS